MTVTVEYTSQLKQITGKASEKIELESASNVQSFVQWLADEHGESFKKFLFNEKGEFRPNLLLCINGKQIAWLTPYELKEGDVIGLLSPISGG